MKQPNRGAASTAGCTTCSEWHVEQDINALGAEDRSQAWISHGGAGQRVDPEFVGDGGDRQAARAVARVRRGQHRTGLVDGVGHQPEGLDAGGLLRGHRDPHETDATGTRGWTRAAIVRVHAPPGESLFAAAT